MPGVAPNGVRTSYPLRVMGEEIVVDSPLVGRHQLRNVALAIAAAEELNRAGFRATARDIERGIRETRWPGRFQRIAATAGAPEIILDVAHNPAGAWAHGPKTPCGTVTRDSCAPPVNDLTEGGAPMVNWAANLSATRLRETGREACRTADL